MDSSQFLPEKHHSRESAVQDARPRAQDAPSSDQRTRTILRRGSAVLVAVGLASSLGVYFGHHWFHNTFLPALDISPALGDSIGGFAIILVAYLGQRIVSLALFKDTELGTTTAALQLEQANRGLQMELGELDRLASTDTLTGTWNRRHLEERIRSEMERLVRYGQPLSLLALDIDFFKAINDQYGHCMGDRVLVKIASEVRKNLRSSDSLARWGGEEFVVLCPNTTLTTATQLAERLRQDIAQTDFLPAGKITASFGVAECLLGETWEQWFRRTDAALYLAKSGGRNQVQAAPETRSRNTPGENIATRFQRLVWRSSYESGNESIDHEHQKLFIHANELLAMILSGAATDRIGTLAEALVKELEIHFRNEETILAAAAYADTASHAREHHQLIIEAKVLVEGFCQQTADGSELFHFLAHVVIARHLLGSDRKFFPCLKSRPEIPPAPCVPVPACP